MGIRGLSGYIKKNPNDFFELHGLHDTYLVIDGMNMVAALYSICDKQLGRMGGQYDSFFEVVRKFVEALLRCDIRPIVVFDSLNTINKENFMQMIGDKWAQVPSDTSCLVPEFVINVFCSVLTSFKIKWVRTIGEADETIVALAKALDCPVLSNDGDFFLEGIEVTSFDLLDRTPLTGSKDRNKFFMLCLLYNVESFCKKFVSNSGILDESVLPLALPILGNKNGRSYLNNDIMLPFFEKLERDYTADTRNYNHKRIEKFFKWLSQYSSITEAIASILTCIKMEDRQNIFDNIRMMLSKVGIASSLAIKALDLPESITIQILEENSRKMVQIQEAMSPLKTLMELNIDEELKDHYSIERELVAIFPEWMIDDLFRGKLPCRPFELFMFSLAPLKTRTEDESQPPTGFTSLPILEKIYSILLSLGNEDENLLEIIYPRGTEIQGMKRMIRTTSFDLRNIASYEESEKRRVVIKTLSINNSNRLNQLPNCWRLYVATIVFWLKQNVMPRKKKAHAFAVILAMLQGRVDEEIGVVRSMLTFDEEFGDAYKDIISKPELMSKLVKGLSLRETMKRINKDECIAAAPFFIRNSSMTALEFQQLDGDWKRIVHTFTQLHSCLKEAMILNSMLRYPYVGVPLHRTYNGVLFYKFFKTFEEHDDVDEYLRGQLQHSPWILESFFVLRDIVLSMLGEKSWDRF